MPTLTVGKTDIPYSLKRTGLCEKARITVTPDVVEVIVPPHASDEEIAGALHRRRRWIFDETRKMQGLVNSVPSVSRLRTGVKIPFRGRMMRLTVVPTDDSLVHVRYRHGLMVECPASLDEASWNAVIEDALRIWFKKRLRQDIASIIQQYGAPNDLSPPSFKIKDQKHLWGSCGKGGVIYINWHLIFAPKPVLEYAVLHELCHLRYRNHSPAFWALMQEIMPDYEARKAWLDKNENLLGVSVLGA